MYPSGGGEENVESAALGIIILWTTWYKTCNHTGNVQLYKCDQLKMKASIMITDHIAVICDFGRKRSS